MYSLLIFKNSGYMFYCILLSVSVTPEEWDDKLFWWTIWSDLFEEVFSKVELFSFSFVRSFIMCFTVSNSIKYIMLVVGLASWGGQSFVL